MPEYLPEELVSIDAALDSLLQNVRLQRQRERVVIEAALGRVLACSVEASADIPPFDNSAMDGYAVRSVDVRKNRPLRISQRVKAGQTAKPLENGTAARVFTGAPLPRGADTVIKQELCREDDGKVIPETESAHLGENVRVRGHSVKQGQVVLQRGIRMSSRHVGLVAAAGIGEVMVVPAPRVVLLATGEELIRPGQPLQPGRIYDANTPMLSTLVAECGCEMVRTGTLPDDPDLISEALAAAGEEADVVITTGGVSVGEADYVRDAIRQQGELNVWRIAVKPGKPFAYGRIGDAVFIGLPGNPVSAYVTFMLLVRPYLLTLGGQSDLQSNKLRVRAGFAHRAGARREYHRARLRQTDTGEYEAFLHAQQGSDALLGLAWAEGLVEIPENASVECGDHVSFLRFS